MFRITRITDEIYEATADDKRIFVAIAVKGLAEGRPGVSEFERVMQLLDTQVQWPPHGSMHIDEIRKSHMARQRVVKLMNLAADGDIVGFLCSSEAVARATIKAVKNQGAP